MYRYVKHLKVTLVLMILFLLASAAIQGESASSYSLLRSKWKVMLTGGQSYSLSDPAISKTVKQLDYTVDDYRKKLNKSPDRSYLWSDLSSRTDSSHITRMYLRLRDMALAYSTKGSKYQKNQELKKDIVNALEWLYTYRYNEKTQKYANWWDWEIGTPRHLTDITVLMYDDLSINQRNKYMRVVGKFNSMDKMTGANKATKTIIRALHGIITEEKDRIASANEELSDLLQYVTKDDGFYRDGSFIQHSKIPYTGTYGREQLEDIANLIYLLKGSPWEVTDTNVVNIYQWVYQAFEPIIYKGAMMDMVSGRDISRSYSQDHMRGHRSIATILRLAKTADPKNAAAFKSMVKYWIQADTYRNFFDSASIEMIIFARQIVADKSIPARGEFVKHKQYPYMDRVVHLRPGFGFGISMSSSRIYNYESINYENVKGWYTGDGMTYLYNYDLGQYSDAYWATINPYRLPGTTVTTKKRANGSGDSEVTSKDWVGGSELEGVYGVAGMDTATNNSTLTAKRSWFMFDDEIVAMGSDITSHENESVETIVENRKLNQTGNNALTVNGIKKTSSLGWKERLPQVRWMHLEGTGGYYFPWQPTVNALRETRSNSWNTINKNMSQSNMRRNFLTLWFDYGKNPTNQKYVYVLLPNKNVAQVKEYSNKPEIVIMTNNSSIHAVKETSLGILAANFWDKGTVDYVHSFHPASVMVRDFNGKLDFSVSDPTHKQKTIIVELKKDVKEIVSKDPSITVESLQPTIRLSIDVSREPGKTHKITFTR